MSRRVSVHHFVLAELVRPQSQTWRACDLFRVSHWVDVPADTEFPYTVPRVQVFTRFYLDRPRPVEFLVRLWWSDHPSGHPVMLNEFGPYLVPFVRDEAVRDCSFNLNNMRLQGTGSHFLQLVREKRVSWDADG
jgi:hypothetical protein